MSIYYYGGRMSLMYTPWVSPEVDLSVSCRSCGGCAWVAGKVSLYRCDYCGRPKPPAGCSDLSSDAIEVTTFADARPQFISPLAFETVRR